MYFGKDIDDDYIDLDEPTSELAKEQHNPQRMDTSSGEQTADMSDTSYIFDTSGGNGAASAIDEQIDKNAVIENDGRSKTRTFFYPEQAAEHDQHQYKRLIRWQDGEGDSQRAVENRAADRRRTIGTFCSHLDMSPYHQERIEYIVSGVNMSHMAHYSSPKVILAIVSLVANADDWFIRDDEMFRTLLTDVGMDPNELRKIRQLVQKKSTRL